MATAFQSNAFQNNAFQISGGAVVVTPPTPAPLPGGVGRAPWRKNYASTFEFYRKKLKKEQEEEYRGELLQLADVAERLSQQQVAREETANASSRLNEYYDRFERQVEQFIQDAARDSERRATLARIVREAEEAARIEAELQDDEQAAIILLLH